MFLSIDIMEIVKMFAWLETAPTGAMSQSIEYYYSNGEQVAVFSYSLEEDRWVVRPGIDRR